jgi:predicted Zn-dependent protease
MLFRRHSSAVSRTLTAAAALIAAVGVANCTSLTARNGSLGGTLTGTNFSGLSLSDVLLEANGTYITRLLVDRDSTIERWPNRIDQPLRIWIDSTAKVPGMLGIFPEAVRSAFSEWEDTGIPIRFVYVHKPNDADIRVRWIDHLEHKTGSTTWRTDHDGWLTTSEITLATHVSNGDPLDARGMKAIALHEVGHALGLSHSVDAHDIMAPLVRVDNLSGPDRSTIKLLYTLPAGHVR